MGESRRAKFHSGSHLGQIWGDDHFAERALRESGQSGLVKPPAMRAIITAVCQADEIDTAMLYEPGQGRSGSEARAMTAWVVQGLEGVTLISLAEEIGRELSALSQAAGRLRKRKAEKIVPDPISWFTPLVWN